MKGSLNWFHFNNLENPMIFTALLELLNLEAHLSIIHLIHTF